MTGRVYMEAGRPVRLLIWPNQKRRGLPEPLPYVRLRPYPPRNVLIEREDGTCVVRPFRGLRRPT